MNVRQAFAFQGEACVMLGSPFMGRLMPLIGERLAGGAVADRVLGWQGDPSPYGDSVPLRLAGALHALKIEGLALRAVYPPEDADDDTLWAAVDAAMKTHEARILRWLDSPPQTNEVRRSAPLVGALASLAERYPDPVELLELGCSGGLNLRADHYRIPVGDRGFGPATSPVRIVTEWERPARVATPRPVVARRGVDLAPIEPATAEGRLRLLAYLWPDQPERIAMTDAAIALARDVPAEITAGDAGAWIERILSTPAPGRTRVVFHTIAWQYFPPDTQARALAAMTNAEGPLVRFAMEADGGRGARLTLTHYPSGHVQELGRADFHGRWIGWAG